MLTQGSKRNFTLEFNKTVWYNYLLIALKLSTHLLREFYTTTRRTLSRHTVKNRQQAGLNYHTSKKVYFLDAFENSIFSTFAVSKKVEFYFIDVYLLAYTFLYEYGKVGDYYININTIPNPILCETLNMLAIQHHMLILSRLLPIFNCMSAQPAIL